MGPGRPAGAGGCRRCLPGLCGMASTDARIRGIILPDGYVAVPISMPTTSNPMSGSRSSDEELLRTAQTHADIHRRREAAVELVCRYRDAVYLWCFRYTRDRERALDLSQDVLASVWEKLDSFNGRAKFTSWLFSVTRNRCIDASRRPNLFTDELEAEDLPDPNPSPDATLDNAFEEGWLLQAVRHGLAPDEQEAVWLHYVEQLPIDEVTRVMRIESASGARAVLQRARRKLRAAF